MNSRGPALSQGGSAEVTLEYGKKTLFIRKVPLSTTAKEVEEVFANYGKIRSCYLIAGNGDRHRGIGFVQFADEASAAKALQQCKTFTLDYAAKKTHQAFYREKVLKNRGASTPKHLWLVKKLEPATQRSKKALLQKCRSVASLISWRLWRGCVYVDPGSEDDSTILVDELGFERVGVYEIIVRNLPFALEREVLVKEFFAFGPLSVRLGKGFAFLKLPSACDQRKAIEKMNGKVIGEREIAVDEAMDTENWVREEAKEQESHEVDHNLDIAKQIMADGVEPAPNPVSTTAPLDSSERIKHTPLKRPGVGERGSDRRPQKIQAVDLAIPGSATRESLQKQPADAISRGSSRNVRRELESKNVKDQEKQSRHKSLEELGHTVFIRGIQQDLEASNLKDLYARFGRVLYARCVEARGTGETTGSAFVCFSDPKSAQRCLEAYKEVCQKSTGKEDGRKRLVNSVLQPLLPESDESSKPFINNETGHLIFVDMAKPRSEAPKRVRETLKAERKESKREKRKLHLLLEGVIPMHSPAAKGMDPEEVEKRWLSFVKRRDALKRDPSLSVSDKRLSIKNLPHHWTEADLRKCVLRASKEHESGTGAPRIHQVKLLRRDGTGARQKASEGRKTGSSKRQAYVEFEDCNDAVACLRYLNNHPTAFAQSAEGTPRGRHGCDRPLVEFAIEKRGVLARRALRTSRVQAVEEGEKGDAAEKGDNEKDKLRAKRKRRAENRRARKEAGQAGKKARLE